MIASLVALSLHATPMQVAVAAAVFECRPVPAGATLPFGLTVTSDETGKDMMGLPSRVITFAPGDVRVFGQTPTALTFDLMRNPMGRQHDARRITFDMPYTDLKAAVEAAFPGATCEASPPHAYCEVARGSPGLDPGKSIVLRGDGRTSSLSCHG